MDEVTGPQVAFEQHLARAPLEGAQGGRFHGQDGGLIGEADQVAGVGKPLLAVEVDDEAGHVGVPAGAVGAGQAGDHIDQPPVLVVAGTGHGDAKKTGEVQYGAIGARRAGAGPGAPVQETGASRARTWGLRTWRLGLRGARHVFSVPRLLRPAGPDAAGARRPGVGGPADGPAPGPGKLPHQHVRHRAGLAPRALRPGPRGTNKCPWA